MPNAPLLLASDGYLYGTTFFGGNYGYGSVYRLRPNGTGYETVHSFSSFDGANPMGGLIEFGGALYGVTNSSGGTVLWGTIFRLELGPPFAVEVLHHFDYPTSGSSPAGGLLALNGLLYGTAQFGGPHGNGTVFAFDPNTQDLSIVHAFDDSAGKWPTGNLVEADGFLYGTTEAGGQNPPGTTFGHDLGTLYRIRHVGAAAVELRALGECRSAALRAAEGRKVSVRHGAGRHGQWGAVQIRHHRRSVRASVWAFQLDGWPRLSTERCADDGRQRPSLWHRRRGWHVGRRRHLRGRPRDRAAHGCDAVQLREQLNGQTAQPGTDPSRRTAVRSRAPSRPQRQRHGVQLQPRLGTDSSPQGIRTLWRDPARRSAHRSRRRPYRRVLRRRTLPVRYGFQVELDDLERDSPPLVRSGEPKVAFPRLA